MAPPALTIPLGVLLLLCAAWAAVTARGGWIGALRRDGRLGVRTPAASASEHSFEVANKVASPVLAGSAAAAAVTGVLLLALRLTSSAAVVIAALGLVTTVGLAVAGATLGERVARTLPVPARVPGSAGPNPACGGCGCGSGGCAGLTRRTPAAPAAG